METTFNGLKFIEQTETLKWNICGGKLLVLQAIKVRETDADFSRD